MAQIEVKGEVVGLVFQNKGIQILETFKTKTGEGSQRYTAWLDAPATVQVGQKVTAKGLLSASIGNYKNKDGEEKTVTNLSINFATVTVDGTAPVQDELPF
jgi:hypothetical protein